MKSQLLLAIRHVRKREREAMAQHGATSWLLTNIRLWRRFHYLAVIPLSMHGMRGFYVRSNGFVNSKGQMTRSALAHAGIDPKFLQPRVASSSWIRIRKATRLLVRMPTAILIAARLSNRVRQSKEDIGIIIATILAQRMLVRNHNLIPIINSDLSPSQVIVACAAQGVNRPSVWWQDDFHYTEPVPFHVAAAAVLNRNGLGAVQARNPGAMILQRQPQAGLTNLQPPENMRIPATVRRAGVAVNGLFSGEKNELEMLSRLRRATGVDELELRLHPTAGNAPRNLPDKIRISPQDESVDEFCSRLDLAFSGNSAIQYKMVVAGTPVIHVSGLDGLEFDLYRYVDKGLVFGSRAIEETIVARALDFYRSGRFRAQITAHQDYQNDVSGRPLQEIAKLLTLERT